MILVTTLARVIATRAGADKIGLTHMVAAHAMVEVDSAVAKTLFMQASHALGHDFADIASELSVEEIYAARQLKPVFERDAEALISQLGLKLAADEMVFSRVDRRFAEMLDKVNAMGARIPFLGPRPGSGAAIAKPSGKVQPRSERDERAQQRPPEQSQQHPPEPPAAAPNHQQTQSTLQRVQTIMAALNAKVFGQEYALAQLQQVLQSSLLQPPRKGPFASLVMLGSATTGKTFTATQLQLAMGDEWKFVSVDMSSMVHQSQTQQLDGTERSYNNAQPGMLTSFVRRNPRSVVVFDNFDKAHPVVLNRLLSIFTEGQMTDQFGFYENNDPDKDLLAPPEVDFTQTIVVFTSKALQHIHDAADFKLLQSKGQSYVAETLRGALRKLTSLIGDTPVFAGGLLDYLPLDSYLVFQPLGKAALAQVAANSFAQVQQQLRQRTGCDIRIEPPELVLELLTLALLPNVNARRVEEQLEKYFTQLLTERIRTNSLPKALAWQVSPAAAQAFAELQQASGDGDLLRYMTRKGQVLHLQWVDNGDVVTLQELHTEKVIQHEDIEGVGAVDIEVPDVTFADIAGHQVVKDKLKQVLSLIQAPKQLQQFDVDLPKGMLLFGPPGTGKTMLAKALANEADLPFISVSGTDLLDLKFLRGVFQRARKYAPSILFIDEIDVVGNRDNNANFKVIVNQLLTEIDGFSTRSDSPVFIIAATNRPNDLDSALVRSGRIDIHIEVPNLDRQARGYFLEKFLQLPNDGSLQREALLDISAGMSGADLEKVRRELVFFLLQHGLEQIDHELLMQFLNQRKYGHRSTVARSLEDRVMTAYHEAGHAVVSRVLNPERAIEQVNISQLGGSHGFVAFHQEQQVSKRLTRKEMLEEIAVRLAGRYAEIHQYGDDGLCAGATEDLKQASALALKAVSYYGLDDDVGLFSFAAISNEFQVALAELMMRRSQVWLNQAAELCQQTLAAHWPTVERVVALLLEHEVIDGHMLEKAMNAA